MADCLIIGGGVIGLSVAYELACRGQTVSVVDSAQTGKQASWAGAGILPPRSERPDRSAYQQLAGLSQRLHPQWASRLREESGIDNGYRQCGGIYVARDDTAAGRLAGKARRWSEDGIHVEQLDPDGLREIEPGLASRDTSGPEIRAACLLPEEAQLRSPRHLKALTVACALRGVEIRQGVSAEDFLVRGGRVQSVVTSSGKVQANHVCLTSGCWTGRLAARLDLATSIRPKRGQMALLACARPPLQRIVTEGSRYIVPRPDGRTLVGSTMEDVGFDCHTTTTGIAGLLDFAISLVADLRQATVERTWAGLRPATADGRPYLSGVPGIENAWIAAGHHRSGLHLSPATAVVMGQLISGESPQIDLTPFSVNRA